MVDVVVIRKVDRSALKHGHHVRRESLVALRDASVAAGANRVRPRAATNRLRGRPRRSSPLRRSDRAGGGGASPPRIGIDPKLGASGGKRCGDFDGADDAACRALVRRGRPWRRRLWSPRRQWRRSRGRRSGRRPRNGGHGGSDTRRNSRRSSATSGRRAWRDGRAADQGTRGAALTSKDFDACTRQMHAGPTRGKRGGPAKKNNRVCVRVWLRLTNAFHCDLRRGQLTRDPLRR